MIVDEAHNAVTGLTREMQARVNPCAIVEFTATPRDKKGRPFSNILHTVTALELKAEAMIKLPILLSEHDTWQGAVSGAIAARASLARSANGDTSYIRPLVLFQAQPKNQEVTVGILKAYLTEQEGIPSDRIAVATGDQRELDGIDLFDRACKIEYVITIEALKEGWDCSFAYVFCSVARIQSAVNVEQLLGRVLRMPYATRRRISDLNKAYACVSEPTFGAAAQALADKLVAMGFEEDEARDHIEPVQHELGGSGDLFAPYDEAPPAFRHTITASPELVSKLKEIEHDGVTVHETDDRAVEITVAGRLENRLEEQLLEALPESEWQGFSRAVERHRLAVRERLSSAEQGEEFRAPRLMSAIQGELGFADTEVFMEYHDWKLLDHSLRLEEGEFAIRETARGFVIDYSDKDGITYQLVSEEEQIALNVDVEGWTPETLVLWLDRQVRWPDIRQIELVRWLRDVVGHLIDVRGMHVSALMRCKYLLARKIRDKIEGIRRAERKTAYQRYLFAPEARVEVSFEHAFTLRNDMYRSGRRYRGRWKPSKHFLGADRVPAFDGAEEGEEFRCAQAIDSLPGLRYWIRNVARDSASFWLPTATGRFYPDFVARLDDGRLLVVEYKGAFLTNEPETREKRAIGALWERQSGGEGLFLMAEKMVDGKDVRDQLMEKTGIRRG